MIKKQLFAGAAITDVTPQKPMFLHGYPHVERISEGTHDPLYASAMILDDGKNQIGFCAVDVIFITKEITTKAREQVQKITGIKGENLMISASHTHSGPVIFSDIFYDPIVPKADPDYITYLVNKIVQVYIEAFNSKIESKIAITTADGSGVGGNRHSTTDAIDPEIPIIVLKDAVTDKIFALSTVYCMHPTILHEDSKLYSADFPGYTRKYIKGKLGDDVILLYHTGPSGNQSPRHFINANTFTEAERLGFKLGKQIIESVSQLNEFDYQDWFTINNQQSQINLPQKKFMTLDEAEKKVILVKNKLDKMRLDKEDVKEIRTVECNWFGALENNQLAKMSVSGELEKIYKYVLPAEVNIIGLGDTRFVFLPGEIFVEYSLLIKELINTKIFISTMSNGVLAGYIVTEEAEREGGYEASNSIFPAKAGQLLLNTLNHLIKTK